MRQETMACIEQCCGAILREGWEFAERPVTERLPKVQVAVRASANGMFTFELFTVSGEPHTFQVDRRNYPTPGDAAQAGYEAISAKRS
jgi:hypothetical protein